MASCEYHSGKPILTLNLSPDSRTKTLKGLLIEERAYLRVDLYQFRSTLAHRLRRLLYFMEHSSLCFDLLYKQKN